MRRAADDLDRLMAGETPAELARVAAVLRAAGAPPADAELRAEPAMAAAMASEAARGTARRVHMPHRLSARKRVAVIALAATLMMTGGLAAAGALPAPAQNVAHAVLGKVGIHVPNAHAGLHPYQRGKSGNTKPKKFGPAPSVSPSAPAGRDNGKSELHKPARQGG